MSVAPFKPVSKADAAEVLGVGCTKTIDNYIKDGLLPQPVRFAGRELPMTEKALFARRSLVEVADEQVRHARLVGLRVVHEQAVMLFGLDALLGGNVPLSSSRQSKYVQPC